MKNVLLLAPLFILMSCQPTKTVEPATSPGDINVTAPYMWGSGDFPRNLKISRSFIAAEVSNIQAMSGAWELAVENKKNFFNNTDRTDEVDSASLNMDDLGDDDVTGIYKIQNWPLSLSGGALAVTQIFGRRYNIGSSNEYVKITHADILINEQDFDFRTGDTGADTYDLRTVVLHEMGHFLGLSHNLSTTNSVMYPSINENAKKIVPTNIDIGEIVSRYNISLSSAAGAIIANKPVYKPAPNDAGQEIKIMIELMADGECIHRENGVVIQRHHAQLK
jgi:hypothetical protein